MSSETTKKKRTSKKGASSEDNAPPNPDQNNASSTTNLSESGGKENSSSSSSSSSSGEETPKKKERKKGVAKSKRAGLVFNAGRVKGWMNKNRMRAKKGVDVCFAAILQIISRNLVEHTISNMNKNPTTLSESGFVISYIPTIDATKNFEPYRYMDIHVEKMALPLSGLQGHVLQEVPKYDDGSFKTIQSRTRKISEKDGESSSSSSSSKKTSDDNSIVISYPSHSLNFYPVFKKKPGFSKNSEATSSSSNKTVIQYSETETSKKSHKKNSSSSAQSGELANEEKNNEEADVELSKKKKGTKRKRDNDEDEGGESSSTKSKKKAKNGNVPPADENMSVSRETEEVF